MRVALRAGFTGDTADAAGARAVRDALRAAGVDLVVEAREVGGNACRDDAPPPSDRPGPVNAHLQWCAAEDVDPEVMAPVRVARVRVGEHTGREVVAALRTMDEVWVGTEAERAHLLGLGLDGGHVRICREPVGHLDAAAEAPAGAHGRIWVAPAPDPARLRNLVGVWTATVPADADATLILTGGERLQDDVLALLGDESLAIADLMLICEPLTDRERLGLIRAAHLVISADPRVAAEGAAVGVATADLACDPAALASAFSRPGELPRMPGDVRHDPHAVSGVVLGRLSALGHGRHPGVVTARPRVVLEGSIFGAHSLAAVNRGLARALQRRGEIDLVLRNSEGAVLNPDAPVHESVRSLVWGCCRTQAGPPQVTVRHGNPADLTPVGDGALVAVLPWEFGGAPAEWVDAMGRGVDEVWVPTDVVRAGFIAAGAPADRVAVVPNGVDPTAYHPSVTPHDLGHGAPGYRFLYVGGLAWRKGVDLLVRAYRMAFRRSDDVTLVLKDFGPNGPYPADGVDELVSGLVSDLGAARVLRLSGPMGELDMPGLYAACDCLVHPYRAEAYGMTMVEAMAVGLPVIAPDRGAAREFMDEQTALLVESTPRELPDRRLAGFRLDVPPVVHEVEVETLAAAMRWAFEHRDEAATVGRRAAGLVADMHTWDHAARAATQRVRRLVDAGVGAGAGRAVA